MVRADAVGNLPGTVGGSFVLAVAKAARVRRRPADHIFKLLVKSCKCADIIFIIIYNF